MKRCILLCYLSVSCLDVRLPCISSGLSDMLQQQAALGGVGVDALVLNKWIMLVARSALPHTLDNIKTLQSIVSDHCFFWFTASHIRSQPPFRPLVLCHACALSLSRSWHFGRVFVQLCVQLLGSHVLCASDSCDRLSKTGRVGQGKHPPRNTKLGQPCW